MSDEEGWGEWWGSSFSQYRSLDDADQWRDATTFSAKQRTLNPVVNWKFLKLVTTMVSFQHDANQKRSSIQKRESRESLVMTLMPNACRTCSFWTNHVFLFISLFILRQVLFDVQFLKDDWMFRLLWDVAKQESRYCKQVEKNSCNLHAY